jgi:hypothetical protein
VAKLGPLFITKTSKKGRVFLTSTFIVNVIVGLRLLRWWKNCCDLASPYGPALFLNTKTQSCIMFKKSVTVLTYHHHKLLDLTCFTVYYNVWLVNDNRECFSDCAACCLKKCWAIILAVKWKCLVLNTKPEVMSVTLVVHQRAKQEDCMDDCIFDAFTILKNKDKVWSTVLRDGRHAVKNKYAMQRMEIWN